MKPDIWQDSGYQKRPDIRPAGYPVQPLTWQIIQVQLRSSPRGEGEPGPKCIRHQDEEESHPGEL